MTALRIAIIADIHHGPDHLTKKGSAALPLMSEFTRFVADARPVIVVDLGDRITDSDRDNDLAREREVADIFRSIAEPRFHLCGNHDLDHLSLADNEAVLGQSLSHRTIDLGGWRLVFWSPSPCFQPPWGGPILPEADLAWLAAAINAADRPLAIFSHVPLSGHAQTGNYYFENNPERSRYREVEQIRAVLRTAKVPVSCFAGHVHWNTLTTIDGIPHFTQQSLTETFITSPEPAAAWALLELGDTIHWRVFGRDPCEVRLDVVGTARRWMIPRPTVARTKDQQSPSPQTQTAESHDDLATS